MNPGDYRLAVLTTDHHMLYRFYRGIVPGPIWRGKKMIRIGARIVEIWDSGYYEPEGDHGVSADDKAQEMFLQEKIALTFYGRKLRGKFILFKMKMKNASHFNADRSWLLHKLDDEFAIHNDYDSEKLTHRFSLINRALAKEQKQKGE